MSVDGGNGGDADPNAVDAAPAQTVRFVMMGDQGTGTPKQLAVGAAIRTVCATEGCDFVVLLGDNLYPDGAESITDPIWQAEFELPYAGIDVPFHAILGNHDFGASGTDWEREDVQVAYSDVSTRWRMPHPFYELRQGPVGFLALDTNRLMWGMTDDGDQHAWLISTYADLADVPWKIAIGHHPYRSNGVHGNMGNYGTDGDALPPGSSAHQNEGTAVKAFFDELVCGKFDLYAAGHDHDMEWLNAPDQCGGTELVVSGAGGTTAPFTRTETPVFWQEDVLGGFFYVVADATTLRGRFISQDGVTLFERTLTKP